MHLLLSSAGASAKADGPPIKPWSLTKTFLVMKLTAILLLAAVIQVSAKGTAQTVTYSAKSEPLSKVFTVIEEQSGYVFFYRKADLKDLPLISISLKDADIKTALRVVLNNYPLNYEIENKTVIISKKTPAGSLSSPLTSSLTPPVTGVVRGPDGQPLAGVNIMVKGTKRGTVSKSDGSFSIEAKKGEELIISSIGFTERHLIIDDNPSIGLITLPFSDSKLDEVQIIAYGQTSHRLNTGNVTTIKAEEIERQPVNNPLYALQGRVAGLQVTPTTGFAGGAVNIQIRGKNSLNFDAEPLIVVDGLPIVNNITGLGFFNLQQFSALNFINPNDIESIDVLKDADATSIYGSRGANGVILITTKKGKIGDTKVDVNAKSGWAKVGKKMQLLKTQEYLSLRKEAYANTGIDIQTLTPNFRTNTDVTYWDQNRYTDWQKELIGGVAKYNDVQASISGGSTTIKYLLGANYHSETTVFAGSNSDKKGNVHMSMTGTSVNQKFQTIVNASYMSDHNTLPGIDFTTAAIRMAPNAPTLYNSDGTLNWDMMPSGGRSWDNPYAELYREYSATVNNLIASTEVSYKLFPFLALKTGLGYNILNGNSFRARYPFAGRAPEELNFDASASFNTNKVKNLSIEPQANYISNVFEGVLNILIGGSLQTTDREDQVINADGFTSDALLKNLAAAKSYSLNNNSSQYKYIAAFGRMNYNWKNRYLANVSIRRDGSSRFGPGKQFGTFSAIGLGWIFSEESFSKATFPFLSYGKLRFSYGTSGNDGIGDYQYLERYQPIDATDLYQGARGYRTSGLFNPYYAWEVTKKMECGIDLGFIKDRLLVTVSYFRNRSDNQLVGYPFASMAGPGVPTYNLPALLLNNGIEIVLNSQNIKSEYFLWTTSFNITSNRNRLTSFRDLERSGLSSIYEEGQPYYGTVRTFKYARVNSETGIYEFFTTDGHLASDPSDPARYDNGQFLRIMTQPKYYGGISNSLTYRGFNLEIFVQFSKQIGVNPLQYFVSSAGQRLNLPIEFENRWRKPGDNSVIQKVYTSKPNEYALAASRLGASDFSYVDASFIRLKNLSLSYNISEKLKRSTFKNLRLYVQGQNLWTLTKYKGLDPETQSISLPPLRVGTIGLQITL